MISQFILPVLLFSASATGDAGRMPQPGSYAFNWLEPSSRCKKLTRQDLARVSKCTVNDNAFGLDLKSHACKVNRKVELIVYKTAAECEEAWETMQANAP